MYRDGVLSADRRNMESISGDDNYCGFNQHSKLYLTRDKNLLIGATGRIPSEENLNKLKDLLLSLKKKEKGNWFQKLETDSEIRKHINDRSFLYLFFAGKFFAIEKFGEVYAVIEKDTKLPSVNGSGTACATVLIRSGKKLSLSNFYRIVSSACENVSPEFDAVPINEVKGFDL